jgi:hypothetical protein
MGHRAKTKSRQNHCILMHFVFSQGTPCFEEDLKETSTCFGRGKCPIGTPRVKMVSKQVRQQAKAVGHQGRSKRASKQPNAFPIGTETFEGNRCD